MTLQKFHDGIRQCLSGLVSVTFGRIFHGTHACVTALNYKYRSTHCILRDNRNLQCTHIAWRDNSVLWIQKYLLALIFPNLDSGEFDSFKFIHKKAQLWNDKGHHYTSCQLLYDENTTSHSHFSLWQCRILDTDLTETVVWIVFSLRSPKSSKT